MAVPLLIVGLIVLTLTSRINAFKTLVSLSLKDIKFLNNISQNTGYTKLYFTADLLINNPSNFTTAVNSLHIDLIYGNKIIATTFTSLPFKIQSTSTSTIKVNLYVTSGAAITNISAFAYDIIDGSADFKIKGTAKLNAGTIYLDQTQTLSIV
jgi:LEA14-like dessication related protein